MIKAEANRNNTPAAVSPNRKACPSTAEPPADTFANWSTRATKVASEAIREQGTMALFPRSASAAARTTDAVTNAAQKPAKTPTGPKTEPNSNKGPMEFGKVWRAVSRPALISRPLEGAVVCTWRLGDFRRSCFMGQAGAINRALRRV